MKAISLSTDIPCENPRLVSLRVRVHRDTEFERPATVQWPTVLAIKCPVLFEIVIVNPGRYDCLRALSSLDRTGLVYTRVLCVCKTSARY